MSDSLPPAPTSEQPTTTPELGLLSSDAPERRPAPDAGRNATASAPRRAERVPEGAWLGGVCTGLAQHLGWPLMALRLGFVALGLAQFIGVFVYAVLWLLLPPQRSAEEAPGIAAATRTGLRQHHPPRSRRGEVGVVVAVAALSAGMLWLIQLAGWGLQHEVFWPMAFASVGIAIVWRQADTAGRLSASSSAGERGLLVFVRRRGWHLMLHLILGLALVALAVSIVIASTTGLNEVPKVLAMTGVGLMAAGMLAAPWAYHARAALQEARDEMIRADARADVAAHLHDSVLQTLALIQRQADNPKVVAALARRQERELRSWLYGDQAADTTLKAALASAAAEIEDERGVAVDVVTVGDCDVDENLHALVQAAREAMLNAAKHSGAAMVDVYAEVEDDRVEVFVRDRGQGFVADEIAEDRLGVRRSIVDRMERHRGRAIIRSSPAEGTEVRLEMAR